MDNTLERQLLEDLSKNYLRVDELLAKENPPDRLFDFKYEARQMLEEVINKLHDKRDIHAQALKVHFTACIGAIDHEVEEWARCEKDLDFALSIAKTFDDEQKSYIIIPEIVCLNQLGILWCSRGDFAKAEDNLKAAIKSYNDFKGTSTDTSGKNIYDIQDLLDPNSANPSGPDKRKALDVLNTHTHDYFAHVYEKVGKRDLAAKFCHKTLRMQLELKLYEPLEWVQNCYTLSYYYITEELFWLAKQHLAASLFVLNKHRAEIDGKEFQSEDEKEDMIDTYNKELANIDKTIGHYCFFLLAKSNEKLMSSASLQVDDVEVEHTERALDLKTFESIEVNASVFDPIPIIPAQNFEEARSIFLPGQRHFNNAKKYFNFAEHCSDYTDMNQELSIMHKHLENFEADLDRKFKIHKQRVSLLDEPLKELSHSVFLLVCRQLMYELAEIHECMMDAKLDKIRATGTPPDQQAATKINGIIRKSIDYFCQYLDTFKDSDGNIPDRLTSENVRPVLVAYFHLARLWSKFLVPQVSTKELESNIMSLRYFKMIVKYCEKNPEAVEKIYNELEVSKDLVSLLPAKINLIKVQLERLNT